MRVCAYACMGKGAGILCARVYMLNPSAASDARERAHEHHRQGGKKLRYTDGVADYFRDVLNRSNPLDQ